MYKLLGACLLLGGLVFGWTVDAQLSAPEKINEAFDRTVKSDVKYRFVIDCKQL